MTNEWDTYAAGWDGDPAARAYAVAAFDSLTTLLDSEATRLGGADVLDFGCGTGLLTEHLVAAGATVVAVDTSSAMLAVLSEKIEREGWSTVRSSSDLPTAPDIFDLVVCSSVCAFLDDYPGTVRRLVSLLRPAGRFVQWDWERTAEDDHGLAREEVASALASAGLLDVEVDTAFSVEIDGHTMAPLVGSGRRAG